MQWQAITCDLCKYCIYQILVFSWKKAHFFDRLIGGERERIGLNQAVYIGIYGFNDSPQRIKDAKIENLQIAKENEAFKTFHSKYNPQNLLHVSHCTAKSANSLSNSLLFNKFAFVLLCRGHLRSRRSFAKFPCQQYKHSNDSECEKYSRVSAVSTRLISAHAGRTFYDTVAFISAFQHDCLLTVFSIFRLGFGLVLEKILEKFSSENHLTNFPLLP